MNGSYLAVLMKNKELNRTIAKHARRYSSLVEDQEEYIQEAWLRISKQKEDEIISFYCDEGRRAIYAMYMRSWKKNNVYHKIGQKVNGNSKRGERDPRKYVAIERDRYIKRDLVSLDSWYYQEEWKDWVTIEGYKSWVLRRDAEHHGIDHHYIEKNYSKKWRLHEIEVP